MKTNSYFLIFALLNLSLTSCKKDDPKPEPEPIIAPIELNCSYQNGVRLVNHNLTGVDYIVNCDVQILGGKLQIDTNVTIQFSKGSSLTVKENAYIEAIGTTDKRISFQSTSLNNTSWDGLFIESDDTRNKLEFCTITDGGDYESNAYVGYSGTGLSQKANVYVYGKVAISNCIISGSEGDGVFFDSESTAITFSNNTLSNNSRYPITIYPPNLKNLNLMSCTYTGNTNNFIGIYSVTSNREVEFSTVINKAPISYFGIESLNFTNNLEINSGATLIMASSKLISISGNGFIKAIGTATEPITIRGEVSSSGFWDGIFVNTNNSLNEFNYLNVSDGGNEPTATISSIKANISVGSRVSSAQLKLSNTNSTNFVGCALAVTGFASNTIVVNNSTITIPAVCTEN